MTDNSLEKLETDLCLSDSILDCDKALELFLQKKSIDTFSFTYYAYHPNSANELKYDMCSANFTAWHKHYINENYSDIDSTLRFVYDNHLPIHWNLKQQLAQAKDEKEKQMRLDSIQFGAEEGLSIPIHGPHNNFAILLVVQMEKQTCYLNQLSVQHELFTAASIYFHYIQSHLLESLSDNNKFHLTQRELQCLHLIHKQLTVREMAQRLELTERTINFHIQKLNKKLGCKNKYQSLAKALEYRLLTI